MSLLFEPLAIGELTLANRIIIAPMCQYSAQEGNAGDWHLIHLGSLALSRAGMRIVEGRAAACVVLRMIGQRCQKLVHKVAGRGMDLAPIQP